MSWIEALAKEKGTRVILVSQDGHGHWGFEVGKSYDIVQIKNRWGFLGVSRYEGGLCCPSINWAWVFESDYGVCENE